MKAIVSLSGGMDSATVLGSALDAGREVIGVAFTYGSKHNEYENAAAWAVARYYHLKSFQIISLKEVMSLFKSSLLKTGGDIPEGHYEAKTMEQTVVPGRNMIFASILAGLAWSLEAREVWLGVHAGDHAIYPDCRPAFYHAMREAMVTGTDGRVTLEAPFLYLDKAQILTRGYGFSSPVPYELTRTCYKDQPVACGKCGSCQERLTAFAKLGREDPLEYETRALLPKQS